MIFALVCFCEIFLYIINLIKYLDCPIAPAGPAGNPGPKGPPGLQGQPGETPQSYDNGLVEGPPGPIGPAGQVNNYFF